MISIINEGIKEHLKKHGRKYIGGALALGGAALGGAAYGQAKEGAGEMEKHEKTLRSLHKAAQDIDPEKKIERSRATTKAVNEWRRLKSDPEYAKSTQKARVGVGKLAAGGFLSGAGAGIAAKKKKELRNQKGIK